MTKFLFLSLVLLALFCTHTLSKEQAILPTQVTKDLHFWDTTTWTWANFVEWDWKLNMDKLVDTPSSALKFWMQWLKSPRVISQQEFIDNTIIYSDLFINYLMMYNKGVWMEVQGLFLQQKYGKAIRRGFRYVGSFFLDYWN